MFDSSDELIRFQFSEVQQQDMTVALASEFGSAALHEARHFPHTIYAEPMFQYAFEVRAAHRKKDIVITGVPERLKLNRLIDNRGRKIQPPSSGILLNEYLAGLQ